MKPRLAMALVLIGCLLAAGCGPKWCNLYGPSTEAEFNKVVETCQQEIQRQNEYLRQQGVDPDLSGWNMATCLEIWGWYQCGR